MLEHRIELDFFPNSAVHSHSHASPVLLSPSLNIYRVFLLLLFTMTTTSLRYVHAHESAQTVSPDLLRQPFQVYVSPSNDA